MVTPRERRRLEAARKARAEEELYHTYGTPVRLPRDRTMPKTPRSLNASCESDVFDALSDDSDEVRTRRYASDGLETFARDEDDQIAPGKDGLLDKLLAMSSIEPGTGQDDLLERAQHILKSMHTSVMARRAAARRQQARSEAGV